MSCIQKFTGVLFGIILIEPVLLFSQTNPFVSFDVQPGAGCSILIQWEIFPDMDTLKYEVEKSTDKQKWEVITKMDAKSSHKYFTMDTEPVDSFNYYRVRQIDNRGKYVYSDTKWIQINTASDIFIWPNPARDLLHLKTPFLNGNIDMMDTGGKLIRKIIITDFITDISIGSLAKGVYFLHIRHESQFLVQKFMKE